MKEVISSALKIGAKCFVFSERFSTFVAPIFIALRVSQSDVTTQLILHRKWYLCSGSAAKRQLVT